MPKHSEDFADTSIVIEDDDSLKVAGKLIDVEYDPAADKWWTRYLPYNRYDSLLELARAVAGDTLEFLDPQE